jgi:hypothetical protein
VAVHFPQGLPKGTLGSIIDVIQVDCIKEEKDDSPYIIRLKEIEWMGKTSLAL